MPAAELLQSPTANSPRRCNCVSRLLRAMKTARLMEEVARQPSLRRLVESLVDQLLEVMPELKDTTAWPAVGHRRKQDELGQAFFRRISRDFFVRPNRGEMQPAIRASGNARKSRPRMPPIAMGGRWARHKLKASNKKGTGTSQ